jgi:hypothetical protein
VIRKVEMERFTVISARPFDEIVAAIKASIGNPNMAEFVKSTQEAKTATDLEVAIQPVLGRTGLMLFVEFDQGMILRKGTDRHGSRIVRLVIGNPLIMKEMRSMFRTPARMLRLPSSWMSVPTAYISHMTGWPAS